MIRSRLVFGLLPLLFMAAGCFHQATSGERWSSYQRVALLRTGDDPLEDFITKRTAYVLATAGAEFLTDRPGRVSLAGTNDGREVQLFTGTAAILSTDGYLLTAAHCAAAPNVVVVGAYGEREVLRPRVVWMGRAGDPVLDVALLKVDSTFPACFEWASAADVRRKTRVALAGIDLDGARLSLSYAGGTLVDPTWRRSGKRQAPIDAISHDAPLRRGDSGGPLLTTDGRLVGINVAVRYGLWPQFSVALRPNPAWIAYLIDADRRSHEPALEPVVDFSIGWR